MLQLDHATPQVLDMQERHDTTSGQQHTLLHLQMHRKPFKSYSHNLPLKPKP